MSDKAGSSNNNNSNTEDETSSDGQLNLRDFIEALIHTSTVLVQSSSGTTNQVDKIPQTSLLLSLYGRLINSQQSAPLTGAAATDTNDTETAMMTAIPSTPSQLQITSNSLIQQNRPLDLYALLQFWLDVQNVTLTGPQISDLICTWTQLDDFVSAQCREDSFQQQLLQNPLDSGLHLQSPPLSPWAILPASPLDYALQSIQQPPVPVGNTPVTATTTTTAKSEDDSPRGQSPPDQNSNSAAVGARRRMSSFSPADQTRRMSSVAPSTYTSDADAMSLASSRPNTTSSAYSRGVFSSRDTSSIAGVFNSADSAASSNPPTVSNHSNVILRQWRSRSSSPVNIHPLVITASHTQTSFGSSSSEQAPTTVINPQQTQMPSPSPISTTTTATFMSSNNYRSVTHFEKPRFVKRPSKLSHILETQPASTLSVNTDLPRLAVATDPLKSIYVKLLDFAIANKLKLPVESYMNASRQLLHRGQVEKAIESLLCVPEKQRTLDVVKLLVYMFIIKRPKDMASAKKVLETYGDINGFSLKVDAPPPLPPPPSSSSGDKTVAAATSTYSVSDDARSEGYLLWFYYTSLVRDAKWSECLVRYEEARMNSLPNTWTFLDNAIMEVCLTYREYEFGWQVHEKMREMDRHTPAIVITICWKAFFNSLDSSDSSNASKNVQDASKNTQDASKNVQEERYKWEARAWAVYGKIKNTKGLKLTKAAEKYVAGRLQEIVKESPQKDSRDAKSARLQQEIVKSTSLNSSAVSGSNTSGSFVSASSK